MCLTYLLSYFEVFPAYDLHSGHRFSSSILLSLQLQNPQGGLTIRDIIKVSFAPLNKKTSQIKCAVFSWTTVSASAWPGFLPPDSQRVLLNVKMVWLSSQFPTVGKTE